MKKIALARALSAAFAAASFVSLPAAAAGPLDSTSLLWTQKHASAAAAGFSSEIVTFDSKTSTLWVAGVTGVEVLNARTGASISFIDTSEYGLINSVAIHNGIAAFAMESKFVDGVSKRSDAGQVVLFDTSTKKLLTNGINKIQVGALPDMLTFTKDGSKLLVANEATPNPKADANYVTPDPAGSVSIIDMSSRSVIATPGFVGVSQTGTAIRNPGMDFEPEYIAVNASGSKAFVTLQEANAIGVLDLQTNQFTKVVGLGTKDFSLPGNEIDTRSGGGVSFASAAVKGFYMPDGIAAYERAGKTYLVMANEGDSREDGADSKSASFYGAGGDLANLKVTTDSTNGNLLAFGGRSFSIRDENGNLVYDSGSILDREAAKLGIYADGRSTDKGVEPEGIELMEIGGKTFAFVGLERTTGPADPTRTGAIAVFDVTNPNAASFVKMLVNANGVLRPEGLEGFTLDGMHYLAIASEGTGNALNTNIGTSVFSLAPVPEPETYALMLAGLGLLALGARRRQGKTA